MICGVFAVGLLTPQCIGGFFFLRFICPAIVAPSGFGITSVNTQPCQRALILISKVIQNVSNAITERKEVKGVIPSYQLLI